MQQRPENQEKMSGEHLAINSYLKSASQTDTKTDSFTLRTLKYVLILTVFRYSNNLNTLSV